MTAKNRHNTDLIEWNTSRLDHTKYFTSHSILTPSSQALESADPLFPSINNTQLQKAYQPTPSTPSTLN